MAEFQLKLHDSIKKNFRLSSVHPYFCFLSVNSNSQRIKNSIPNTISKTKSIALDVITSFSLIDKYFLQGKGPGGPNSAALRRRATRQRHILQVATGSVEKQDLDKINMAILPFPWTKGKKNIDFQVRSLFKIKSLLGLKSMLNASLLKAKVCCLVHSKNPVMGSNLQGPQRPQGQLRRSL